jgi:arylsulfatase A-like enzyme
MRLVLCFLVFIGVVRIGLTASPPNFVLFVADDLGATDLGCFGSTFYETPNLDRLAATGMKFTSAYSTCPVCSPSRSSIMTGRYPARTRITDFISRNNTPAKWTRNTRLLPAPYENHLALKERTIAEALQVAGYENFFAGKWHLGGKRYLPTDQGFDGNLGGTNSGSPRSYFSPFNNPYLKDGPIGEELSMRLADEACRFIESNRDRPFFVCLPFYAVHVPLQAPPELIKKYEAKAAALKLSGPEWEHERKTKVRLVQNHPTYAAMIETMDAAVGRILDKLDSLELADNTVVVFTSDNGGLATAEGRPTSNRPLRAGKGWLYEGGIRVPTIVRWPGVTAEGSISARPMTGCDWFPTFLHAANLPKEPQNHVDGRIINDETKESRSLYWHYPHYGNQGGMPGGAIREGRWKLIEWYEDGSVELYDLDADPSETNNIAEERKDIAKRLRAALADWRDEVGAKMPTPNPLYKKPERNQPHSFRPVEKAQAGTLLAHLPPSPALPAEGREPEFALLGRGKTFTSPGDRTASAASLLRGR